MFYKPNYSSHAPKEGGVEEPNVEVGDPCSDGHADNGKDEEVHDMDRHRRYQQHPVEYGCQYNEDDAVDMEPELVYYDTPERDDYDAQRRDD